jgi:peptidoglycan/LPS O-acetylase OafA/YrhL
VSAAAAKDAVEPAGREVSPALEPPPGNPRFPLVDGVRAVAVLTILLYHVGAASHASAGAGVGPLYSHLNVGVTIFFVVSGFLLYRPFIAGRRGYGPAIGTAGYLRRRLLRIVPAYWVALTLLAIWPGLPGVFTHDWWKYYGFLQVYSPRTYLQGIGPTWSLATEMSFYLVLPLYAFALARLTRGAATGAWVRRELLCLLLLSVGTGVFRAYGHAGHTLLNLPPGTLLGTFDWFAVGMALAVASVALGERGREPRTLLLAGPRSLIVWAGAVGAFALLAWGIGLPRVVAFAPTHPVSQAQYLGEHLLMALVALLVVLPAVLGDLSGGVVRSFLRSRPAAFLGLVSYGVFLWHGPVILKLSDEGVGDWIPGAPTLSLALAALAISVPIATLSYYLVERPFLRLKYRRAGGAAGVAAKRAPRRGRAGATG